ncbi:MAG: membrane protein insertase YidC [Deltaproteobacteria bacterium]|nr:membrane protein insertase YidC [Deltaproteobacteria bacterium]
MEKRSLLAVGLSLLLFIAYFWLTGGGAKHPAPAEGTTAPEVAATGKEEPSTSSKPASLRVVEPPEEQILQHPEKLFSWQDKFSQSKWTSVTGLPQSWQLKNFYEQAGKQGGLRELLNLSSQETQESTQNYPMTWLLFPQQGSVLPHFETFEEGQGQAQAKGQYGNLNIQQEVNLTSEAYSFKLRLTLSNQGQEALVVAPGLRILLSQITEKRSFLNFSPQVRQIHPLYYQDNSVERMAKVKDLPAYGEVLGNLNWGGLEDLYFLRAILSERLSQTGALSHQVAYGQSDGQVFADFRYPTESLAPGASKTYEYTVFLGPKSSEALGAFKGLGLDKALDLGFLAFIAKPLLWALKFFHRFLFNWGLAIIVLTLSVRLLTYPLTKKSMSSMKAMKEIQPRLKELQEKYKDDRERLNQEMMSLFRTHKVNPAGGCLPMVLQMPVYFALYRVLYNATELHHAPFVGPYQDLSAPDPYFILPIILGFFFFLQQKLTPSTGDAAQAKMMKFMPVMFTGLMLFLPVGLVLYILVSTALGVLQQYLTQREMKFVDLFRRRA